MKAIRFTISGETAFFKKPDVNTYFYFTYGSIHKLAILGIIGAAIGLEGYNFQNKLEFPQFYSELCSLQISVVPRNSRGYISKKIQIFNNSVGYASQEEGGNLIVKEQWLEKPIWDVYILVDDNKNMRKITDSFLNNKFVYMPYLGKNDHYANIENAGIVELEEFSETAKVSSLFIKEYFEIKGEEKNIFDSDYENEDLWKYEERLPVALESESNQYITAPFVLTNVKVKARARYKLYAETQSEKILFFF